jgi:dienelactone hydrolase
LNERETVKKNHLLKTQTALLVLVLCSALIAFGCENQNSGCGNTDSNTPTNPTNPVGKVCTENMSVNSTSGAMLYYPCNISKPAAASTLTSGTAGTWESVKWLSTDMAAAGYVVLAFTPNNNNGLVPQWTNGHLAAIDKLKQMNNSHSVLRGKIRTDAIQVAGHSKGGGGALHAASQRSNEIASVIAMAPYSKLFGTGSEEYPVNQLSRVNAAVLIQSGGNNDKNSPPNVTREQYDALPNGISKAYHRFDSYGHMAWGANGPTDQHTRLSREIIAWMKYYLDNDRSQANAIQDPSQKGVNLWEK